MCFFGPLRVIKYFPLFIHGCIFIFLLWFSSLFLIFRICLNLHLPRLLFCWFFVLCSLCAVLRSGFWPFFALYIGDLHIDYAFTLSLVGFIEVPFVYFVFLLCFFYLRVGNFVFLICFVVLEPTVWFRDCFIVCCNVSIFLSFSSLLP